LRNFNLAYDLRRQDVPSIQQTMPVILRRMDAVMKNWTWLHFLISISPAVTSTGGG
jgi:hypothetical protein